MNALLRLLPAVCWVIMGCVSEDVEFTQLPKFIDYFKQHPSRITLPTYKEEQLLHRFLPRFFISEDQESFIAWLLEGDLPFDFKRVE